MEYVLPVGKNSQKWVSLVGLKILEIFWEDHEPRGPLIHPQKH